MAPCSTELINIEGNPDSPISGGHLCPERGQRLPAGGQFASRPQRALPSRTRITGETRTMDGRWTRLLQRVKAARDAEFTDARRARPPAQLGAQHRHVGRGNALTTRRTTSSRSCSVAAREWYRSRTRPESTQRLGARSGRLHSGRGAATNYQQDMANSDCILFMGSNIAEAQPGRLPLAHGGQGAEARP